MSHHVTLFERDQVCYQGHFMTVGTQYPNSQVIFDNSSMAILYLDGDAT